MNPSYQRGDERLATDETLLMDAAVGLYFVVDANGNRLESVQATLYDIPSDTFRRDVRCYLLARVDDAGELPAEAHRALYRPDGKRVVQMWVVA